MKKFPIVAVLCLIVFVAIAQTIAPFNSNQADTPAGTLYGRGATAGSVQALTLGDGLVVTNAEVSANVATNVYVQNIYNVGSSATTFKGKITIQTNLVVGLGDGFNGGGFNGQPPIYTQGYHFVDEFNYGGASASAAWGVETGGTAANTPPSSATNSVGTFGMWVFTTAAGTNSNTRIISAATNDRSLSFGTGGRRISWLWRAKTPEALSTDADVYVIAFGAMDNTVHTGTDAVMIQYGPHTTSTSFRGMTYSNGSQTLATGGSTVTVVANTWYEFYMSVNADATTADFYVSSDEGINWTYLGQSASNIPNGVGRELSFGAGISKRGGSTGTTARFIILDRFEFWLGSAQGG